MLGAVDCWLIRYDAEIRKIVCDRDDPTVRVALVHFAGYDEADNQWIPFLASSIVEHKDPRYGWVRGLTLRAAVVGVGGEGGGGAR